MNVLTKIDMENPVVRLIGPGSASLPFRTWIGDGGVRAVGGETRLHCVDRGHGRPDVDIDLVLPAGLLDALRAGVERFAPRRVVITRSKAGTWAVTTVRY